MMAERYSNLKEEVDSLIPGCEISSLLDKFLALAYQPFVSKQKKRFCRRLRHGLCTLSFGLSQLHGHGSWLVCEVAFNLH